MGNKQIKYEEICRQEYTNGKYISAGLVKNHTVDEVYLEFGGTKIILLRTDEAASVVWALGGAMYSLLLDVDEKGEVENSND